MSNRVSNRQTESRDRLLRQMESLIREGTTIASQIASDDFTVEERCQLRQCSPVFEFSNLMSALCSETARRMYFDKSAIAGQHKPRKKRG